MPLELPRWHATVLWGGALLMAAAAAAAVYQTWDSWRDTTGQTGRDLDANARILAEQSARTFQAVDLVLRNLVQQQRDGKLEQLDDESLFHLLQQQAVGLVQIEGLLVAGADGRIKAVSMGHPVAPGAPNLSRFRLFQQMRTEPPGQLLVGGAGLSPVDNLEVFLVARRLEAPDGAFGGVAAARGRVDYFQRFYRDIELGPGTQVSLLHRSGAVLASHPPAAAPGRPSAAFLGLAAPGWETIAPQLVVDEDSRKQRFAAVQAVPGYPLAVMVTQDADVAFGSWREQAIGTAWRTAVLATVGGALLVLLMRQLRRLEVARHSVEAAQERFALAVAGSDDGIWDWSRGDRFYASARARELLGMPGAPDTQAVREFDAALHVHPDDEPARRAALQDHLAGRTPAYEAEFRVQAGGEDRWVRMRGMCVRDGAGQVQRMAGSVSDIDARKRAEQALRASEAQLRQAQKLEALGTLAGGIAHDFNNILAAILGYGEMAQRGAPPGQPLRRHIDAVMSAGMRARSLVARILAFSRGGVGERVPVHVESIVAEALELVEASLPQGMRLLSVRDGGDAAVLGDATQIHQVVMNLCANAVQATGGDGTLTVATDTLALEEPRIVATSTLAPGRYVRIRVQDTGSGIAPAVLERIFDPFFTTKEVGVGTGLGLSLVHGIVTELGGGIAVESRPGAGSTFTVLLPRLGQDLRQEPAGPGSVEQGHGQVVMLVDDEEPLVRLGEELLAGLGYEPVGFSSSLAAHRAFHEDPDRFEALLTDESMPELGGVELARDLLALRPGLPVVVMSGDITPQLVARAREAGVTQLLNKPLESRDIARHLAEALRAPAFR